MILLELPVLAINCGFFSASAWCSLYAGKVALLAGGPGLGVPGWAEGKRGLT